MKNIDFQEKFQRYLTVRSLPSSTYAYSQVHCQTKANYRRSARFLAEQLPRCPTLSPINTITVNTNKLSSASRRERERTRKGSPSISVRQRRDFPGTGLEHRDGDVYRSPGEIVVSNQSGLRWLQALRTAPRSSRVKVSGCNRGRASSYGRTRRQ